MKQEKITDRGKNILKALAEKKYKCTVPEDDVIDFLILQEKGFVSAVAASDKDGTSYYSPSITPKGLAYLAEYPNLSDPSKRVDWKWVIATAIAIGTLVLTAL